MAERDWQFWLREDGSVLAVTFEFDTINALINNASVDGILEDNGIVGEGISVGAGINLSKFRGPQARGYIGLSDQTIIESWEGDFTNFNIAGGLGSASGFFSKSYWGVEVGPPPLGVGIGFSSSVTSFYAIRSTRVNPSLGAMKEHILKGLSSQKEKGSRAIEEAKLLIDEKINGAKQLVDRFFHPTWKHY